MVYLPDKRSAEEFGADIVADTAAEDVVDAGTLWDNAIRVYNSL